LASGSASGSESGFISQRHGSADPDPHQNVMELQQEINIKIVNIQGFLDKFVRIQIKTLIGNSELQIWILETKLF
jgi:hypothetical protein